MSEIKHTHTRDGVPIVKVNFPLFKDDKKESDNHPDYRSWCKETGIGVSAWLKTSPKGVKYMSCVLEYPDNAAPHASEHVHAGPANTPAEDFDDDIPF